MSLSSNDFLGWSKSYHIYNIDINNYVFITEVYPPYLVTKKYFKMHSPISKRPLQVSPSPHSHHPTKYTLTYKRPINYNNSANVNKAKRNRKRQKIWFNPPFNLNTKTKISKSFSHLLDKYFPLHNKLHRLFKKTNMKISFSCMPKMNSYFYMHNHNVLNDKPNETESVAIKILVLY